MIWLADFPLPPSVNEYLMPVVSRGGRKAHFVKTKTHTDYLKRCHLWRAYHNRAFTEIQDELLGAQAQARRERRNFALRVDHYFAFEHSRLWTVNNLAEQIDADNRLKPCRDALATLLGIDDKYFFSGYFEKISTTSKDSECSMIRIAPMTPRTLMEVKAMARAEMRPGD